VSWALAAGWYLTASRGYKAGGFNIGAFVPDDRREFEPEYLWNLEAGVRHASEDGALSAELSVFHMWRESQQVATSFQLDPGDPLSYVFYTDNAARGRNAGLEASLAWRPVPVLTLGATLGLLHSEYLGYRYGDRDLDGREQAHAPGYQYSLSAEWNAGRGWMARADLSGSDAFYFDASHDQRSQPYALLNLRPAMRASAGRCTPGGATCSTSATPCAGSTSASSRRISPTSSTCSRAIRGSSA
jgi:iron complex outermembrane recepter protein